MIINTNDSAAINGPAQSIVAISANGNTIDIDAGAIVPVDANGQRSAGIEAVAGAARPIS